MYYVRKKINVKKNIYDLELLQVKEKKSDGSLDCKRISGTTGMVDMRDPVQISAIPEGFIMISSREFGRLTRELVNKFLRK